jgi:hypothetical protein
MYMYRLALLDRCDPPWYVYRGRIHRSGARVGRRWRGRRRGPRMPRARVGPLRQSPKMESLPTACSTESTMNSTYMPNRKTEYIHGGRKRNAGSRNKEHARQMLRNTQDSFTYAFVERPRAARDSGDCNARARAAQGQSVREAYTPRRSWESPDRRCMSARSWRSRQ